MGISTRRSGRLAEKAKSGGASSSATPKSNIRKAVRKGVSKAKAVAAATVAARSPRKAAMPKPPATVFPDVELLDHEGKVVKTGQLFNESAFIVFLYPRANTPGCTNQACGFGDHSEELAGLGYKVFGLSYDSPKSQMNWKNKRSLPYPLWCDTPAVGLIKKLGAHKDTKSVKRSHFVVAKGGAIVDRHVQISPKNSVLGALEYARAHPVRDQDAAAEVKAAAVDEGTDDAMDVEKMVEEKPVEEAAAEAKVDEEMTEEKVEGKRAEEEASKEAEEGNTSMEAVAENAMDTEAAAEKGGEKTEKSGGQVGATEVAVAKEDAEERGAKEDQEMKTEEPVTEAAEPPKAEEPKEVGNGKSVDPPPQSDAGKTGVAKATETAAAPKEEPAKEASTNKDSAPSTDNAAAMASA